MAPPTPFKTHFDPELKNHIVVVQDRKTGEFKRFVYNHESQRFELATTPNAVHEADLEPLYETKCQRHQRLVFCRNAKLGNQVFKYTMADEKSPWRKVQCICCEFNAQTPILNSWVGAIKSTMTPGRRVDEENANCLWFQPVFSKWCESTQKITVFAGIYPWLDKLFPYNFDVEKQTFVKSECRKDCCQERTLGACAPRTFDFGAQGHSFARCHHDQAGRPLICLAISWYNKEHGQMEIFMDQDGDIGRYEWNDKLKCFLLQKTLEPRCLNQPSEPTNSNKTLSYDDDLRFMSVQACASLNENVYYCWHLSDGVTRKYIFNPVTLQFVLVECACCRFNEFTNNDAMGTLGTYLCPATQGQVIISRNKDSGLDKVMVTIYGTRVTMPKSPIRDDSHLSPFEITSRRQSELLNITQMTQLFTAEGLEGWVLRKQRTSSDGCTQIGTMALMDGSVKPFTLDCQRANFAIYHHDCVNLTARNQPAKQAIKCDLYSLDWDLTPEKMVKCEHFYEQILTCFNNFTGQRGTYVFDTKTGHFKEHPACGMCTVDFPITPSSVIFPTKSPYCSNIFLATNSVGRLIKVGRNPISGELCPMIPMRIITAADETFQPQHPMSEAFAFHEKVDACLRDKLVSLEEMVIHNQERHRKNENKQAEMIQDLQAKLGQMTLEVEKERQRADAAERASNTTPLMDKELCPTYRNYCPHTGHFIITALNTRDQSIGHYIFNPTTGLFHHHEYCAGCGDYTQGIKVQKFVTLMPAESPLTKFPFLVMTDDNCRLVKIGFCTKTNGFVNYPPSVVQPAPTDMRLVPNAMKAVASAIATPADQGGPYDCHFVPTWRVYCKHCFEFLLFGYHEELQRFMCCMYNSKTGHLEEHLGCSECQGSNPRYDIGKMRSVMPAISPYSKWPIMLTTNVNGQLMPIAFKTENHRFNSMPRLKIVMLKDKDCEVSTPRVVVNNQNQTPPDLVIKEVPAMMDQSAKAIPQEIPQEIPQPPVAPIDQTSYPVTFVPMNYTPIMSYPMGYGAYPFMPCYNDQTAYAFSAFPQQFQPAPTAIPRANLTSEWHVFQAVNPQEAASAPTAEEEEVVVADMASVAAAPASVVAPAPVAFAPAAFAPVAVAPALVAAAPAPVVSPVVAPAPVAAAPVAAAPVATAPAPVAPAPVATAPAPVSAAPPAATEPQIEDKEESEYSDEEDEEFSDEEEEYSDEEEEYSDEEEDEEEEEEDEEEQEEKVEESQPLFALPTAFQMIPQQIRAFTNFLSAGLPSTSDAQPGEEKKDEEDLSDEEEWCCSDEECCCCSDEECSDEECSDEECSDEECSDEECSDEECSDEECSDEESSCEDCSDDECHCEDEEDEEYSDEEDEEEQDEAEEERKKAEEAEQQRKIAEEQLKEVQRVCNFEPATTTTTTETSTETSTNLKLDLHPDFSVNERKFEEARAQLREAEEEEEAAKTLVQLAQKEYLKPETVPAPTCNIITISDDDELYEEEVSDVDDKEEPSTSKTPATTTTEGVDYEKMAEEQGKTLEELANELASKLAVEVAELTESESKSRKRPLLNLVSGVERQPTALEIKLAEHARRHPNIPYDLMMMSSDDEDSDVKLYEGVRNCHAERFEATVSDGEEKLEDSVADRHPERFGSRPVSVAEEQSDDSIIKLDENVLLNCHPERFAVPAVSDRKEQLVDSDIELDESVLLNCHAERFAIPAVSDRKEQLVDSDIELDESVLLNCHAERFAIPAVSDRKEQLDVSDIELDGSVLLDCHAERFAVPAVSDRKEQDPNVSLNSTQSSVNTAAMVEDLQSMYGEQVLEKEDDSGSDISHVESIGIEEISDTESVSTALEPEEESFDVRSLSSTSEPELVDSASVEDDYLESFKSQVIPRPVINFQLHGEPMDGVLYLKKREEEESDGSDISHVDSIGIEDISDTESVSTALEPEDDVESDAESTATALEPEEEEPEEKDDDDISILSSTSTAREFSIAHDSESSTGSDISYLDDISGSEDGAVYDDAEEHQAEQPRAPVPPIAPIEANQCVIS